MLLMLAWRQSTPEVAGLATLGGGPMLAEGRRCTLLIHISRL
jgi:hypothetical protein